MGFRVCIFPSLLHQSNSHFGRAKEWIVKSLCFRTADQPCLPPTTNTLVPAAQAVSIGKQARDIRSEVTNLPGAHIEGDVVFYMKAPATREGQAVVPPVRPGIGERREAAPSAAPHNIPVTSSGIDADDAFDEQFMDQLYVEEEASRSTAVEKAEAKGGSQAKTVPALSRAESLGTPVHSGSRLSESTRGIADKPRHALAFHPSC